MKRLNRCIILSGSLFCLLLPKKIVRACGFYTAPGEYRFWLLQPDLVNRPDLSPFFFATTYLYRGSMDQAVDKTVEKNIGEWHALFTREILKQDIEDILYNTDPDSFFINLPALQQTNSFMKKLSLPENQELFQYLLLSKKTEAVAGNPDPWEESPAINVSASRVFDQFEQLYRQTRSPWIRLRSAYQQMRLYRYQGRHAEAGSLYDTRIAASHTGSWIESAAMYEKAGTLHNDEGSYYYSKVFDRSDFRRAYCVAYFNAKNYPQVLQYAKNNHERSVILAMYILNYPGRALEQIKSLYAKEPGYKELPFLLMRELNKLEDWLVTNKVTAFYPATREEDYNWDTDSKTAAQLYRADKAYARQVYDFLMQVIQEKKNKSPELYYLYASHLALIQGDYTLSNNLLQTAKKYKPASANIHTQLQVNELLLHLLMNKGLDAPMENQLITILTTPGKKLGVYSPDLMKDQLTLFVAKKLIGYGERVKGLMLLGKTRRAWADLVPVASYKHVYHELQEIATPEEIDSLLAILDRKNKSAFERYVSTGRLHSPMEYYWYYNDEEYENEWAPSTWSRSKIIDIKASWYIQHDNLEAALEILQQIPGTYWQQQTYKDNIEGNPFFVNVNHSHRTEPGEGKTYNKKELVAAMIGLKQKAQTDKAHAGQYYYELANAFYNLSWHGKNWIMVKQWWSRWEFEDAGEGKIKKNDFNDVYYGCSIAGKYYREALLAANDKKLASLSCYMSGICEKNYKDYLHVAFNGTNEPVYKNSALALLKKKGVGTKYYDEIVKECATYQAFIQQYNRQKL